LTLGTRGTVTGAFAGAGSGIFAGSAIVIPLLPLHAAILSPLMLLHRK
jgi:hypothetical protein